MKIFELNEADITTGKLVDVKPGAEATIDMGDGTKTIVDLKKNPTALVKSPDGKTMFNKAGMTSGGVQPTTPDPSQMFKPGEPVTISTTQTEAAEDTNDTFYFFDVARGGHSFREQDLTAMGLKRSRSGKWYYCPRRSESPTSLRSKLDRLERILNIKAKIWKPELQEFSGNFTGGGPIGPSESQEPMDENLRKWFKEKWVRFGPDGKIRGECGGRDDSEGKPKCLPASKAHALGKKGRASAGARKRREDPNPERSGPAINVATKKNEAQAQLDEKCWDTHRQVGMKKKGSRMVPNCVPKEGAPVNSKKSYLDSEPYNPPRDAQGRSYLDSEPYNPPRDAQGRSYLDFDPMQSQLDPSGKSYFDVDPMQSQLDPSGKSYFDEGHQMCPECGGAMLEISMMNEKKDACYYKVKSRYKVWPSAYASGALVKCRKKGAKNWGSKRESMHEGGFDIPEIPRAPQPQPEKNKTSEQKDAIDARLTAQYSTPQAKAQSQAIDRAFASGDEAEFRRLGIQSPQQIERDYQAMLAKEPEQDAALMRNPKLTPSARPVQKYNPKGVPIRERDVEEAGPFSYGARKPRKGSVADLAAKKRKEQERDKQPVEPRDHMVGVARVVKEYGDTKKGQKQLTRVHKRAVNRVIKADDKNRLEPDYTKRDLATVRKNQATADRAWDRFTDMDLEEASVYKKDQDLSGVSTQELEAFVRKHWFGGVPTYGQGESVKRAIRELRRREKQGVAEGFDELVKFINDKYGPQPRGGSGIKLGKYGRAGEKSRGRPIGATGGHGSDIPRNVDFDRPHSERSAGRRIPRFSDDYDSIRRSDMDEASTREKLHRRHQELRKKSGLPDPDYYKEMLATYDLDDRERLARQAEIKKKYRVNK